LNSLNTPEDHNCHWELSIMTSSPLKKFVLTPVVLSAAVFAALTLPLAVLGSKPVTIKLQKEPVFQGQLRDVATPYLGLASALSLGAGIAGVAVTGWRVSSRKSSQAEAQLSDLEQHLKEKEALLEQLKLSESRVAAAGLGAFMDEELPLAQSLKTPEANQDAGQVKEPVMVAAQPVEVPPVAMPQTTVQAAAAKFASAQTFLGYTQSNGSGKLSSQVNSPTPGEVEELHTQLQQVMAQMASLQVALSAKESALKSEVQLPASTAQLKVVKSWSVHELAS
jgi:hypothetical protein